MYKLGDAVQIIGLPIFNPGFRIGDVAVVKAISLSGTLYISPGDSDERSGILINHHGVLPCVKLYKAFNNSKKPSWL